MLHNNNTTVSTGPPSSDVFTNSGLSNRRKRRPAGTPDPDAEVVSLSPKTLLESDRYVCEICNQGFQRNQNLQMHRRRHKVPWKLLKRESPDIRKRVFVCPEPTCLHHDPCHALGDLVGIKKHFRRKHSNNKQWVCEKCSKGYAVQSDYKAHLKTCGTRGHSCDCGRVFSRVESFIEHQDACTVRRVQPDRLQQVVLQQKQQQQACSSRTASSASPSSENNNILSNMSNLLRSFPLPTPPQVQQPQSADRDHMRNIPTHRDHDNQPRQNLELQLLPLSSNTTKTCQLSNLNHDENHAIDLNLSVGNKDFDGSGLALRTEEQLKIAKMEHVFAEGARKQAKRQIELAEMEFANAKNIRQQAQAEFEKAHFLKEQATKKINSTMLEITCHACKQRFHATKTTGGAMYADETSLGMSYMSNSAITEGEGE
ncbi:Protein SHOOT GRAVITROPISM 5 [Heracleum sosnowskyi]|uniref:Protein SHOOT GRAVITROPISM 5 n=1 Tax=Heracleum sosnowskyi TaxID=360622 RepID=A0AAD8MUM5_9APIA|nr:Protein SHOOT GRAVITROPISM 5 [Heracleum sosnowskyi]